MALNTGGSKSARPLGRSVQKMTSVIRKIPSAVAVVRGTPRTTDVIFKHPVDSGKIS